MNMKKIIAAITCCLILLAGCAECYDEIPDLPTIDSIVSKAKSVRDGDYEGNKMYLYDMGNMSLSEAVYFLSEYIEKVEEKNKYDCICVESSSDRIGYYIMDQDENTVAVVGIYKEESSGTVNIILTPLP